MTSLNEQSTLDRSYYRYKLLDPATGLTGYVVYKSKGNPYFKWTSDNQMYQYESQASRDLTKIKGLRHVYPARFYEMKLIRGRWRKVLINGIKEAPQNVRIAKVKVTVKEV